MSVLPKIQNKDTGSKLLAELIYDSQKCQYQLYLETYLQKYTQSYVKFDFEIFQELRFRFHFYCMRRNLID